MKPFAKTVFLVCLFVLLGTAGIARANSSCAELFLPPGGPLKNGLAWISVDPADSTNSAIFGRPVEVAYRDRLVEIRPNHDGYALRDFPNIGYERNTVPTTLRSLNHMLSDLEKMRAAVLRQDPQTPVTLLQQAIDLLAKASDPTRTTNDYVYTSVVYFLRAAEAYLNWRKTGSSSVLAESFGLMTRGFSDGLTLVDNSDAPSTISKIITLNPGLRARILLLYTNKDLHYRRFPYIIEEGWILLHIMRSHSPVFNRSHMGHDVFHSSLRANARSFHRFPSPDAFLDHQRDNVQKLDELFRRLDRHDPQLIRMVEFLLMEYTIEGNKSVIDKLPGEIQQITLLQSWYRALANPQGELDRRILHLHDQSGSSRPDRELFKRAVSFLTEFFGQPMIELPDATFEGQP